MGKHTTDIVKRAIEKGLGDEFQLRKRMMYRDLHDYVPFSDRYDSRIVYVYRRDGAYVGMITVDKNAIVLQKALALPMKLNLCDPDCFAKIKEFMSNDL